jgi:hypothetical protein
VSDGKRLAKHSDRLGLLALRDDRVLDEDGAVKSSWEQVQFDVHTGLQQAQRIGYALVAQRVEMHNGDIGRLQTCQTPANGPDRPPEQKAAGSNPAG